MGRRSDVDVLIDYLIDRQRHSASRSAVMEHLGWAPDKLLRAVERGRGEGLSFGRGRGGTVMYRGTERGSSNGLYGDVARVAEQYLARQKLGFRNIEVLYTSKAGRRGSGAWTHPDLVIVADPRKRDPGERQRRLTAIEVETKAGFDLKSVYQAHAQGFGANHTWVIGRHHPDEGVAHWRRVERTARELNVGLVTFDRPGVTSTWVIWHVAPRLRPTAEEREEFLETALGPRLRQKIGL